MTKKAKVLLIIFSSLVILLAVMLIAGTYGMNDVKNYKLPDIDLSKIPDGDYKGSCNISRWALTLSVTVKDHKIISVKVIDNQSNINKEMADKLNKNIIGQDKPKFDIITGASITSKSYFIAITDALNKTKK